MTEEQLCEAGTEAFRRASLEVLRANTTDDAPFEDLVRVLAWTYAHAIVFGETMSDAPEDWTRSKFGEYLDRSVSALRRAGVGRGTVQ